jgi:hypothetical protein
MQETLRGRGWYNFLPWKGLALSTFFGSCGMCVFWPSLFVSPVMVLAVDLLLDFCSIALLAWRLGEDSTDFKHLVRRISKTQEWVGKKD